MRYRFVGILPPVSTPEILTLRLDRFQGARSVEGRSVRTERGGIHIEYLIAFMVMRAVAYPSVSWGVIYRLENALRLFTSTLADSFN